MKYKLFFIIYCLSLSNTFAMKTNLSDLIQTPTARFNEAETFSIGIYNHDSISGIYSNYQWGEKAQFDIYKQKDSSIKTDDKYSNSMNIKFRLKEETAYSPQIALSFSSLSGDNYDESEYLTFSRKFYNLDFHTGIGWGAIASRGNTKNPLSFLGGHFKQNKRDYNNRFNTLFTGEKASIFGGISYQASDDIKFKLEYNDNNKNPISLGADYKISNFTLSGAIYNSDKIMTRLNYSYDTKKLKPNYSEKVKKIRKSRNNKVNLSAIRIVNKATANDINAFGASINNNSADLWIEFKEQDNAKQNVLDASRLLYNYTNSKVKWLSIIQTRNDLTGVKTSILRKDLENLDTYNGSMEGLFSKAKISSAYNEGPNHSYKNSFSKYSFIRPGIDIDISQKHKSLAYRSYIIAGLRSHKDSLKDYSRGMAIRLNLSDNMKEYWQQSKGKGTEKYFANNRLYLENFYTRKTYRPWEELYIDIQSGYLEEMYAGVALEAMYKPSLSNWAISLNLDDVYQRKDYTAFGFYASDDSIIGASLYYEPEYLENTLLKLSVTEYLSTDSGIKLSAEKTFRNNVKLKLFGNFSNLSDDKVNVTESFRVNTGINLSIPIGHGSKNNYFDINMSPLGLISGESINKPENLYEDLRNISYNNLIKFKR